MQRELQASLFSNLFPVITWCFSCQLNIVKDDKQPNKDAMTLNKMTDFCGLTIAGNVEIRSSIMMPLNGKRTF